jgi:Annexin
MTNARRPLLAPASSDAPLRTPAQPAVPLRDSPAALRVDLAAPTPAAVPTAMPNSAAVNRPPHMLQLTSVTALQRTAGNQATVFALQREPVAGFGAAPPAPAPAPAVPRSGPPAHTPQPAANAKPAATPDALKPAAASAPAAAGDRPTAAGAANTVPGAAPDAAPKAAAAADKAAPLAPRGLAAPAASGSSGGGASGGDVDGSGPVGAWQAKVQGAVSKVKPRPLSGGQGAAVAKVGKDVVDKQKQQAGKLPDEAKQVVPKPKQPSDLPAFPDDETRSAIAKLDPKLGRTHTAHTLPALQKTPQNHVPLIAPEATPVPAPGGEGKHPDAKDGQGAQADKDGKDAKAGKTAKDPKAEAAAKAAADAKAAAEAEARKTPAAGVTVKADAPEAVGDPEIVSSKTDVAAVVARLLAEPERHAKRIVDDAKHVAYNGKLETAWPDCGKTLPTGERSFVDQELRRVAAAVGVGEEALNEKIASARTQLSADGKTIEADVGTALATARQDVATSNALFIRSVAAVHTLIDGQVEERAAAAKGDVDLAKVRADRERLVGLVNTKAGQGVVAYEAAAKKLKAALGGEVEKQRRAYRDAAAEDDKSLKASITDSEKAREAYRPTKYWLDERLLALRTFQSAAEREIDTQVETFTTELNEAAGQAREDVRDWAARRIGYERSFFQRLLDMFADWMAQAQVQTAAWDKRRAAQAAAQVDKDLQFIQDEAAKLNTMSQEEKQRELGRLRADQIAILTTLFTTKNLEAALAEGMITRLSMQRREFLLKRFESEVMALSFDDRQWVYAVAAAESPGLVPTERADRLHDAFKGPGTNEEQVFQALSGLTPLGGRAVEYAYQATWQENLRERLKSELDDWATWSKHDINRATALLEGQGADAIAVQLDQAMHGNWNGLDLGGTDEDTIFAALRNKTPDEIAAIKKAYKARYGRDLQAEVRSELHESWIAGTHDEDRGEALFASDTQLADVIGMDQAMHGGWLGLGLGTDRKALEDVYTTNDKELEQEAEAKGWDSATLATKKTERRKVLDDKYQGKYNKSLSSQLDDELSGADFNLVSGMREQDWNKVDAARIALEHDSIFYADDKVINDALQGGFKRSYADRKRDLNLKIDEEMAADWAAAQQGDTPEARKAALQNYYKNWSPEKIREKRKQALTNARTDADTAAQANFPQLEAAYDGAYKGKTSIWNATGTYGGLRADVAQDTQLAQGEKAQALIANKGKLSETEEVHYAIKGAGTDTEIVRDIFKGKNKKEMETLGGNWEKEHPGEGSFKDFVLGDFSGREDQEMRAQIDFGEAETPREKARRAKDLLDFEKSSWLNSGSQREVEVMKERYDKLEADAKVYDEHMKTQDQPDFDWEKHSALAGKADASSALFDSAVTSHRKSVDVVSDTAAQVIGAIVTAVVVIAAIVADVATAGGAVAATPGVVAFLGSMWGAITVGAVGLGLTMATKFALRGGAYGWEDASTDFAVGIVDIATMALTAGLAGKMLKGSKPLMQLFSKGRIGRVLAKGIVQGAEGMVQAAPGALLGNVLNPANYNKGENAILNVLGGTAVQVAQAGAMSAGMGMLHTALQTDLVRMRTDVAYQEKMFERFEAKNPGKTREDFMRGLDELIRSHTDLGFDDPRMQESMRSKLLEHVPAEQHKFFADVPIEVMSDKEFRAFARSDSGRAVTVIRNGEPVVILRSGTSLGELAFEGPHLQQIQDPKNAARVAKLDEARLGQWDKLTLGEQIDTYKTKVELEIEVHEQILRSLDAQKAQGVEGADRAQTREKTQANLDNLRGQMEKVQAITPQQQLDMAQNPSARPGYLDQPARLFSKEPAMPVAPPVEVEAPKKPGAGEPEKLPADEVHDTKQIKALRAEETKLLHDIEVKGKSATFQDDKVGALTDAIETLHEERADYLAKHPDASPKDQPLRRIENQLQRLEGERTTYRQRAVDTEAEIARMKDRVTEIEAAKEKYKGAKPWRQLAPDEPDVRKPGLAAELEAASVMQGARFEPLGNTVRPDTVLIPEDFETLFGNWKGKQGIDGIYKRTNPTTGETEYWIVESKYSTEIRDPRGTQGALPRMESGELQMSRQWIEDRLAKSGLSPSEIKEVATALAAGDKSKLRTAYAQTDAKGTRFFEIELKGLSGARITTEIHP